LIAKSIPNKAILSENERMKSVLSRSFKWMGKDFSGPIEPPETDANWYRDPLSHPDIARMSQRELADLPFCPERIKPQ
jgi:hypothetical protein